MINAIAKAATPKEAFDRINKGAELIEWQYIRMKY